MIILYFSFNLLLDFLVINNIIFSYLIKSCFLFIILSFLIAFIEEVLFRSFFFRIIKEKTTNIKAYFISSYIYTQSHFLNFNLPIKSIYLNFIGLFILGLILNLFYDKKGLFYSIGFHTAIIFVISLINVNNVFEINENYIFLSGGLNPLNGFLGVFYALILLVFFYNYQKTS
ncbi:MAG: CPBP family intramembrane glutamic endopeptidase [Candidatus Sericytochromatia bacterium]